MCAIGAKLVICLYCSAFTLQVVSIYFYFLQFNLFYKLGTHPVHINEVKSISKMNYKDIDEPKH